MSKRGSSIDCNVKVYSPAIMMLRVLCRTKHSSKLLLLKTKTFETLTKSAGWGNALWTETFVLSNLFFSFKHPTDELTKAVPAQSDCVPLLQAQALCAECFLKPHYKGEETTEMREANEPMNAWLLVATGLRIKCSSSVSPRIMTKTQGHDRKLFSFWEATEIPGLLFAPQHDLPHRGPRTGHCNGKMQPSAAGWMLQRWKQKSSYCSFCDQQCAWICTWSTVVWFIVQKCKMVPGHVIKYYYFCRCNLDPTDLVRKYVTVNAIKPNLMTWCSAYL